MYTIASSGVSVTYKYDNFCEKDIYGRPNDWCDLKSKGAAWRVLTIAAAVGAGISSLCIGLFAVPCCVKGCDGCLTCAGLSFFYVGLGAGLVASVLAGIVWDVDNPIYDDDIGNNKWETGVSIYLNYLAAAIMLIAIGVGAPLRKSNENKKPEHEMATYSTSTV